MVKFGNLKKYLYLCTNYEDIIFIKDLVIPEGMRLDVDENAIVATIADNSAVDTDEDQSEDGTESKQ